MYGLTGSAKNFLKKKANIPFKGQVLLPSLGFCEPARNVVTSRIFRCCSQSRRLQKVFPRMDHLSIQQGRPNFFSTSRNHLLFIHLSPISQAQFSRLKSLDSVNVARYVGDRMIGPLAAVCVVRLQAWFILIFLRCIPFPPPPSGRES